ncbi:MAG: hypothetical protein L3J08_02135 [Flavobacteriaceae bacterium]|nr:hypothetical protein [Flavobacteriaceae bacterium]
MKSLENYGVLEMDAREIRETDGSGWLSDFVHSMKFVTFADLNRWAPGHVGTQYGV